MSTSLNSTSTLTAGISTLTPATPSAQTILDGIVHLHASCVLHDGTMATFLPPLDHATMYRWWQAQLDEVEQGRRHIIVYLSEVSSRTASSSSSASGPDGKREGEGEGEQVTIMIKPPFESEGRGWPVIRAVSVSGPVFESDARPSPNTTKSKEDESTSSIKSIVEYASTGAGDSQASLTSAVAPELEVSGVVSLTTPFSQTGPFRGLVQKLFVSPLHRRKGIARSIVAELESVAWHHGRWSLMLDTTVGSDAEMVYPRLGYTVLGTVNDYGYSPKDGQLRDEIWFWKDLRKARLSRE